MYTKRILFISSIIMMGAISCKKTNSSTTPGVTYKVQTSNKSYSVNTRTTGLNETGTLTWTSGYANVTEIKFDAENNSAHVEYKSETPQKIDLFSTSTLGNISIPSGTYTTAEFDIELAGNASVDAVQLNGNYAGTPVILKITGPYEFDAEMQNVTIGTNGNYSALTTLDLSKLTNGLSASDFANATKDASGTIVISANSNTSIYSAMVSNFHKLADHEDFE